MSCVQQDGSPLPINPPIKKRIRILNYLKNKQTTHLQGKTWLLQAGQHLINHFISMSVSLLLLKGGLQSTISCSCLHRAMVSCQYVIYIDVYLFIYCKPFCIAANLPPQHLQTLNLKKKKKIPGVALKMLITKTVGVPEGWQTPWVCGFIVSEYGPFGLSIDWGGRKRTKQNKKVHLLLTLVRWFR